MKQRQGGGKMLDYIAIETVLGRLLDAAPGYNWDATLESFEGGTAVVSGVLSINGKTATGFGAAKGPDADMSIKSANSEAMKNAAKNGWGLMLELWDEGYRNDLDKRRKLTTPAAMKQEVYKLAREKTGKDKPTPGDIAKTFGVNITELGETETLRGILEAEGLL